jgi:serine/threonine-protein kinase HipA
MARDISNFLPADAAVEFIRRLIFNAAIGNADMHLKNWSVVYPDARTPRLSPGYDFVSTIAYIKDRKMALSVAKEKDTKRLDQPLLEKFAAKAGLPRHMVVQTALETAEKTVRAWTEMASGLSLQDQVRERIEEQLRYLPLTKQFLDVPRKNRPDGAATGKKNARARKPRS